MKKLMIGCLTFLLAALLTATGFAQDKSWTRVLQTLPTRSDGAFIRLNQDQTFRLFAVGSAAYGKDADNEDMLRLEKEASIKAKAELIKFIQQELSASDSIRENFRKAESEIQTNDQKETKSRMISERDFLTQIQSSSAMMIKGIVTLKIITVPRNNGGVIKALVGVSSLTQETSAAISAEPHAAQQQNGTPQQQADVKNNSAPSAADPWIVCIGRGTGRDSAIQAALLEGIQQVYGVYLENEETLKKRFSQLKSKQQNSKEQNTTQTKNTLTKTKGFIREYRIISVTPAGSLQEANIKAWIVNPRSGGIRSIVLYPMSISADRETRDYAVGPELRMSGREIADLCSVKFEQAFNGANKYVVLNKNDLAMVLKQQDQTKEMVLAGKALPLEMAKAGQLLCADYIFIPEFENINYSRKIGYDPKTKKFQPKVTMRISFRYRLIDVRTGAQIRNEDLSVMINDQEIKQLPEDGGEKADMLRLLMNKTVAVIAQRVDFK